MFLFSSSLFDLAGQTTQSGVEDTQWAGPKMHVSTTLGGNDA